MGSLMTSYNFGRNKVNLLNGLIGYFPFDSDLQNKVTNVYMGGAVPSFVSGKIGNATAPYYNSSSETSFNFTDGLGNDQPFTISFWVKMVDSTLRMDCLAKSGSVLGATYDLRIASASVFILLRDSSNRVFLHSKPQTLPNNTWVNIAFSYDGLKTSNSLRGYVNSDVSGFVSTFTVGFSGIQPSGGNMTIKNDSRDLMDDLCIWNRVLTPSEVLANYNRTANLI